MFFHELSNVVLLIRQISFSQPLVMWQCIRRESRRLINEVPPISFRLVPHIPISEIGGLISGSILVLGPNNFLGSSLEVVWP